MYKARQKTNHQTCINIVGILLTINITNWYPATTANAASGDETINDRQYAKSAAATP